MIHVIAHDLEQARGLLEAAAELGIEVDLVAHDDASAFAGVGFLRALETELGRPLLVPCGDRAGDVMAGLRVGLSRFIFEGRADVRARLASMADEAGAELWASWPVPLLRLEPDEPPAPALRRHLARSAATER